MDLIGEERGRLARAATWLQATPAELVGLAVLLTGALAATGVLVWSALGRPALADPGQGHGDGAAASDAGDAAGVGDPADVGDAAGAGATGGSEHDEGAVGAGDPGGPAAVHGDAPPATAVTVHVAGAVATPGVVTLPIGARVTDAVDAAGGLLADADPSRINLARTLEDGEQLLILREGEEPPPASPAGGPAAAGHAAAGPDGPIDLNTASVEQLETLPGIGPGLAGRIVQYRDQHGPFRAPGDLRDVSGIGEKRFQDLADLVTVG